MLFLLAGASFALLAWLQSASAGYFSTPPHRFSTPSVALKSDEIEVGASTARSGDPQLDVGDLARVQIQVRSADPLREIFVGIGPKAAVETYLRGSAYDEFVSAELDPFRATFRRVPGSTSAVPPAAQTFWVATAAGTGLQILEWNKVPGTWSIVIMRPDGEAGIAVDASMGLRFGFLTPAAIGALACGVLLLAFLIRKRYRKDGQT
jgi:hypothetical protein